MKAVFKSLIVPILTLEAKAVLRRRKPKIAVVTGSVGKTSTKDAVGTALSAGFSVRKSEKSFNSDIGVPLTILNLKNAWDNPFLWLLNIVVGFFEIVRPGPYPSWLVLEVGADKPGDLSELFKWLYADVVIVTRFPDIPVHVEFYNSPEDLIREESIPAKKMKKGGVLVLNNDDPKVLALAQGSASYVVTYGLTPEAEIFGSNASLLYQDKKLKGMAFRIDVRGNSIPIEIMGAVGETHVYPILAAVGVALRQGINLVQIKDAFEKHDTPPGRMRLVEGKGGSTIIDDTYNASPVATEEALKTLRAVEGFSRKIAVLGDMLELGKFTEEEHKKIGEKIPGTADLLITVGIKARGIREGAEALGTNADRIFSFDNSKEAAKFVGDIVRGGDIILVKGSQSIRMEKIVEALMAHPEDAKKLLVRQERAWEKR